MYDIIVVGGGAAGMTAALYARRSGKSVLVIEKNVFGGQITYSPKVENYPGTAEMSGNSFGEELLSQILSFDAEIELDEVTKIEKKDRLFAVSTVSETYECKAVILATGAKHRMLGIDGEEELIGSGVSFCAVCDGEFYKGRPAALIGGGNSALQEGVLLSELCSRVTIVQDLDRLTGEPALVKILSEKKNVEIITGSRVTGFVTENDELTGIEIVKTATGEKTPIACDGVFVAIGMVPENGAFEGLAALDERGYFASGEDCATMTDGVFVAGDCRSKSVRQLTTAVSDGACAAVAACRYIDRM